MELLIDSNVILDRMLKREPFWESAKKILDIADKNNNNGINGYISASAVTDIYYIAYRSLKDREKVRVLLSEILKVIKIASISGVNIQYAFDLNWKDFEDAVQYSVALSNGMDAIITRNMKGFSQGEVKICTPEEILDFIKNENVEAKK